MVGEARDSKIGDASVSESESESRSGELDVGSSTVTEIGMSVKEKLVDLLRKRRGKNVLPKDVGDTATCP